MRARGEILNPGLIEASLTFTMSLDDWESIAKQMGTAYPAWKFTSAISELSRQLRSSAYLSESDLSKEA